jgi:hypothetical protein
LPTSSSPAITTSNSSAADRELRRRLEAFAAGDADRVVGVHPADVLALPVATVLEVLRRRLGSAVVEVAIARADGSPASSASVHEIRTPVHAEIDARWLKRANVVGVNVRTVGSFWGVLAYALTLPRAQNAIHLLPVWEPGVVASLYAPSSWQLNDEFRSEELGASDRRLATADRQLQFVIDMLHALGRTVGLDLVPHTDRYSEMALAVPGAFEWLQRRGTRIVQHGPNVAAEVERRIQQWLAEAGEAASRDPHRDPDVARDLLFRPEGESTTVRVLFGLPGDPAGRRARRLALVRVLHYAGFETVPATMAPPYRGLEVDPRPEARSVDEHGLEWRDYRISAPRPMSRVFGPLTRYAFYESGGDGWELDFDRPRRWVWDYVAERYAELQRRYGFDFLRGDMAHVQMRPEGVPERIIGPYDIHGEVKRRIREGSGVPWFGSFAEAFLAPRDTMAYGEEMDHLELADADVALGDLQSVAVTDAAFLRTLRRYRDLLETRRCAPCFTVITADKDDPRFDPFYRFGNAVRFLLSVFLPDMPSYVSLGFETREAHEERASNEHYSKLYVFRQGVGANAVRGPYVWERNMTGWAQVERIRDLADELRDDLAHARVTWRVAPDATGEDRFLAWTLDTRPRRLCVANVGAFPGRRLAVPFREGGAGDWELELTTELGDAVLEPLQGNGLHVVVPALKGGEGRVYRELPPDPDRAPERHDLVAGHDVKGSPR